MGGWQAPPDFKNNYVEIVTPGQIKSLDSIRGAHHSMALLLKPLGEKFEHTFSSSTISNLIKTLPKIESVVHHHRAHKPWIIQSERVQVFNNVIGLLNVLSLTLGTRFCFTCFILPYRRNSTPPDNAH